jgi:alkaline phosphatase D
MFPKQRERLLDLVGEASGTTVFLSGDRHRGEISRLATEGRKPVCDVTASGYFHVREAEERNSLRVGKLINQPHFGALEVDWESRTVAMKVLCSREGTVLVEHEESILP